jgi:hypothetical protein
VIRRRIDGRRHEVMMIGFRSARHPG